jgi:hypothetical protein
LIKKILYTREKSMENQNPFGKINRNLDKLLDGLQRKARKIHMREHPNPDLMSLAEWEAQVEKKRKEKADAEIPVVPREAMPSQSPRPMQLGFLSDQALSENEDGASENEDGASQHW